MQFKVYLGGPISGLTYEQATKWREFVANSLRPEIVAYSPLRFKEHLKNIGILRGSFEDNPLTTQSGIVARDFYDVQSCDLLFVNFLNATEVSQGTDSEIAWAYALRKPIVIVMDKGNLHDHTFVRGQAGFIVETVEAGIAVVKAILLPN